MGAARPRQVVLDTGALIAIERGDGKMSALLEASLKSPLRFFLPTPVLAQAWRDGSRQSRLARFLRTPSVEMLPLTEARAKAAGVLCGLSGTGDVVDAAVVIAAREHRCGVITGDTADLAALDATIPLHIL
jgi:rRNA-processing protein FCF1